MASTEATSEELADLRKRANFQPAHTSEPPNRDVASASSSQELSSDNNSSESDLQKRLADLQKSKPGACLPITSIWRGTMYCPTGVGIEPKVMSWEDIAKRLYHNVCEEREDAVGVPYDNESMAGRPAPKLNQKIKKLIQNNENGEASLVACVIPEAAEIAPKPSKINESPIGSLSTKPSVVSPSVTPAPTSSFPSNGSAASTSPGSGASPQPNAPGGTGGSSAVTIAVPPPKSEMEAMGRTLGQDILNYFSGKPAAEISNNQPDYVGAMNALLGKADAKTSGKPSQNGSSTGSAKPTETPLKKESPVATKPVPQPEPQTASTPTETPSNEIPDVSTPKTAASGPNTAGSNPTSPSVPNVGAGLANQAGASSAQPSALSASAENDRTARFRAGDHANSGGRPVGSRKLADAIKGLDEGIVKKDGIPAGASLGGFQNLLLATNPSGPGVTSEVFGRAAEEYPRRVGEKAGSIHPDAPASGGVGALASTAGEIVRSLRQGGNGGQYALNGDLKNGSSRTWDGPRPLSGGVNGAYSPSYNPGDTFSYQSTGSGKTSSNAAGVSSSEFASLSIPGVPTSRQQIPLGDGQLPRPVPVPVAVPNKDLIKQVEELGRQLKDVDNGADNEVPVPTEDELRKLWEDLKNSFASVRDAATTDLMNFASKAPREEVKLTFA